MSWDTAMLAVSTVAACAAAIFAWWAIHDARAFHADQEAERRRDVLLALTITLADVVEAATEVGGGSATWPPVLAARQLKLAAELAVTNAPLPVCRKIASTDVLASSDVQAGGKLIGALAHAAFTEVRDTLLTPMASDADAP